MMLLLFLDALTNPFGLLNEVYALMRWIVWWYMVSQTGFCVNIGH